MVSLSGRTRLKRASLLAVLPLMWSTGTAQPTNYKPTDGFANTTSMPDDCVTTTVTETSTQAGTWYTTTFITYTRLIIIIPHVTPYSNGTNTTNYVVVTNTEIPFSADITSDMGNPYDVRSVNSVQVAWLSCDPTITTVTLPPELITATLLVDFTVTEPAHFVPTITVTSSTSSMEEVSLGSSAPVPTSTSKQPAPPPASTSDNTSSPPPPPNSNAPTSIPSPEEPALAPVPISTRLQQTLPLPGLPAAPAVTGPTSAKTLPAAFAPPGIGPISFQPSGSGLLLPSETNALQPGDTTLVNGKMVSFDSQGSFLVVESQTFSVPPTVPILPTGFVNLPSSSGILLPNGDTLAPGTVTTLDGIPISLSSDESVVVIGSETIPLALPTNLAALPPGYALLPSGTGLLLPNGQTLAPGTATVVSGVSVSLSPFMTEAVVGGITISLVSPPTDAIVLPNGQTLTPGVLTMINGVSVSLASSPTAVVINGSTVTLTSSGRHEIDGYIWSGLGGATLTSPPAQYTGRANGRNLDEIFKRWAIVVVGVAHAAL